MFAANAIISLKYRSSGAAISEKYTSLWSSTLYIYKSTGVVVIVLWLIGQVEW